MGVEFYLIETRQAAYAKFLQIVAGRDPLKDYTPNERLADFQSAFGKDLNVLEASFLRYMAKLAVTTKLD